MTLPGHPRVDVDALRATFGKRLLENVPMARFTSSRVGGPADALLTIDSLGDFVDAVTQLWRLEAPFTILGGGCNILVSDRGVRALVLLNRSRRVRFAQPGAEAFVPGAADAPPTRAEAPTVWAESGANFGAIARQAATHELSGLEWAAGIPGTLGGAVVGNAGAHGGDVAGSLAVAEILHRVAGAPPERLSWTPADLEFSYRSSRLKRAAQLGAAQPEYVVLAARLNLQHGVRQAIEAKMDEFLEQRRRTQPPGASMGSMFKNPPGDYAGRLIEAAGLKGAGVGDAQISPLHANFFINRGQATAEDIYGLIDLARTSVADKFGVHLELEIELIGDW
jgi:UDP-N-acetylmuramate dehydrogenase